jgi:[acyl-carrier-protein] S-malonyltransferase
VANVDAQIHGPKTYTKDILKQQIASPVRWTQSLATIVENQPENTVWIEVGPGKVLSGLTKKTHPTQTHFVTCDIASLRALLPSE